MRGRCETEQQYAGLWIAEARKRAPPVLLVGERGPPLARDPLAPLDQARAAPARGHVVRQRLKVSICPSRSHRAVVASLGMSLWLLIVLLGLVKVPIAALMLWLPFREERAAASPQTEGSTEDDGGSKALPAGPANPHPRRPHPWGSPRRRGPHGSPTVASPQRTRTQIIGARVERRQTRLVR
jgi:hypothetical protein